MHPVIDSITARIADRSRQTRASYLHLMDRQKDAGALRMHLSCGNLAHAYAAAETDQATLKGGRAVNIGIVTAYNDMLSAHQPYAAYPPQMKLYAREVGATAQVAGGVPAMCDGVTQGMPGMELSLFSRDVIALSTAVALSHGAFEAAALMGICDKIVPGLLIGALRFGHLPMLLIPAGPMPSGVPNREKAQVRQLYAEGKLGREALLESEMASYHSPGTCTFYGTANSNQMMMEMMGLHLPGAAFINPGTRLRAALTRAAVHRLAGVTWHGNDYRPLAQCVDERAIVNAVVGLLATGGSTNHAIHLPAIARAAGILLDWEDIDRLSAAVPLIARVYPNGAADVNQFHAAGGTAYVIGELLAAGFLHADIMAAGDTDFTGFARAPFLDGETLAWAETPRLPGDDTILRPTERPFRPDGGMRLVTGNLGRAIFKTSAVAEDAWTIEAPARVFEDQDEVLRAFKGGAFTQDTVVVVRFQGPRANGMPELHNLSPALGVLQDKGLRVALVTDGRMSGASGKVPAAIHVTPEAIGGGPLAYLRDGDMIRLCAHRGELNTLVDEITLKRRSPAVQTEDERGTGRELFAFMRAGADSAEHGASAMLAAAGL